MIKMILFILDGLIYNLTTYNTYLILLNLSKKKYFSLIIIGLILDLIIFDTYIKNTIVMVLLIIINKYIINFDLKNIINYLSINILNFIIYFILSSFVTFNFSMSTISYLIIENFTLYMVFSLVYYYKFIN